MFTAFTVCLMRTCTCNKGHTLGPHSLYTCVQQRWEGGEGQAPWGSFMCLCTGICRTWVAATDQSDHVSGFFYSPTAYLCVHLPAHNAQRKKEKRGKTILASGLVGCFLFLLPLAFPSCHISWNFFSQLLLLSARKLVHTPLFHQWEREVGRKREWGGSCCLLGLTGGLSSVVHILIFSPQHSLFLFLYCWLKWKTTQWILSNRFA